MILQRKPPFESTSSSIVHKPIGRSRVRKQRWAKLARVVRSREHLSDNHILEAVTFRGEKLNGAKYVIRSQDSKVVVVTLRAGLRQKQGDYWVDRVEENHRRYCQMHDYNYLVFDVPSYIVIL